MLVVDGIRYRLWIPKDEENEFHPMVKEHHKEIFGEDSLYFDVKRVLKTLSGIGSIPDAYVINLKKNEWYVVEIELSSHPVYNHVVNQISRFINAIENSNTTTQIMEAIYKAINDDVILKATVEKSIDSREIHRYVYELFSKAPKIVIIVEQKNPELEDACRALKYQPYIEEFKTFVREDAPNIRAHLFEPMYSAKDNNVGNSTTTHPEEEEEEKESYSYGEIVAFQFKGEKYEVTAWAEVLPKLSTILYESHRNEFQKVLSLKGRKRPYFSGNPEDLRRPVRVSNTNICVEVNLSANATVKLAKDLVKLFGYPEDSLQFEVKK
jgi:hypothetical protein